MSPDPFFVERVVDSEGLAALGGDWSQLACAQKDPMMSHAWFLSAAKTVHAGERLSIFTVRRNGRLTGVAPLVEAQRGKTTWLEIMATRDLHEPSGLLADDPETLFRLCRAITSRRLPVALQRVAPASGLLTVFRKAARWRGTTVRVRSAPTLWVATDRTWAALHLELSPQRRADLRRARRKLEAIGPVQFECLRPAPVETEEVLAQAFAIEAASWKGRNGSAVSCRPQFQRFFQELCRSFAAIGALEVRFLRAGEARVAMQLGLEYGSRWWDLKIGYDEAYARASPGLQLTAAGLKEACDRGLRSHEFLGSPDGWERPWASGERHLESIVFYPYSSAGIRAIANDAWSKLGSTR